MKPQVNDNKVCKVTPEAHSSVFGRPIIELEPGDHFAPYSKICTNCNGRYGPPGTWLKIEKCAKCKKVLEARAKLNAATKKPQKAKHPREPIDPVKFWKKQLAKVS
jgi:hypothetical protein